MLFWKNRYMDIVLTNGIVSMKPEETATMASSPRQILPFFLKDLKTCILEKCMSLEKLTRFQKTFVVNQ